jgi:hypothetical protein
MSLLTNFSDTIARWWDNTKAFFKRSEVIFYSRFQVLSGFMLAVFSGIDWTTVTMKLEDAKQSLYLAGGLIFNGVLTEYLRRRNATLPSA